MLGFVVVSWALGNLPRGYLYGILLVASGGVVFVWSMKQFSELRRQVLNERRHPPEK